MFVLLLILGFAAIILMEVPAMRAKGQRREEVAFWVLLSLGFFLSLAVVLQWPIPNPTEMLEVVFKPISDALGIE